MSMGMTHLTMCTCTHCFWAKMLKAICFLYGSSEIGIASREGTFTQKRTYLIKLRMNLKQIELYHRHFLHVLGSIPSHILSCVCCSLCIISAYHTVANHFFRHATHKMVVTEFRFESLYRFTRNTDNGHAVIEWQQHSSVHCRGTFCSADQSTKLGTINAHNLSFQKGMHSYDLLRESDVQKVVSGQDCHAQQNFVSLAAVQSLPHLGP